MRLNDFIVESAGELASAFEQQASSAPATHKLPTREELRQSAAATLRAVALDMRAAPGSGAATELLSAAGEHAMSRFGAGHPIHQLLEEYRGLRASVTQRWLSSGGAADDERLVELGRFNEAIDKALMQGVSRYTEAMADARDTLIGVLSHDLRNPLGSITMSAQLLLRSENLAPEQSKVAARVLSSAERMRRMVEDLLDYTRTRLGKGLPIRRLPVELGPVLRQSVEELESLHPHRSIAFCCSGELEGRFDGARLAQMLSNLVSNAIQHGDAQAPVEVSVCGGSETLVISVRNRGPVIPEAWHAKIFRPLLRNAMQRDAGQSGSSGLGLGLFIAREIARAHGGQIRLESSHAAGTCFEVSLPRH